MQIDSQIIKDEIFKATPQHIIAEVIASNHPEVRITEQLIDSYVDLSLRREFTLDKTINEIRKMNPYSNDVSNKISFVLEDNSIVAISEETFNIVCNEINNNDIVQYMRESKENFMNVIDVIGEEYGENSFTPNE